MLRRTPFLLLLLASCATAPAAGGPLGDALAAADNPRIEEAARACLTQSGWKVDPLGGLSGGATVVTAYKAKDQTDVYIYPRETRPRITGGPDYSDAFWRCLGQELAPGVAKAPGGPSAPDAGR